MAIATFGFDDAGVASMEEMALVVTNEQWIPVEHVYDLELVAALTYAGRRVSKGLRYNLAGSWPLAPVRCWQTRRPRRRRCTWCPLPPTISTDRRSMR